jgi:hypothetical protein
MIRFHNSSGTTLHRSEGRIFEAGENPEHTVTLPSEINPQDVARVRVYVGLDDNPDHYYVWRFDICTETNAGITAASIPQSPLTVAVGEEVEVRITFNEGYQGETTTSYEPIIISDRTVLDNNSWSYNPETQEGVFKLKGLKSGQTRYAVAYRGDADYGTSGWYHTSFVDVVVGDGSSSGSSSSGSGGGGGGCNAASAPFALFALGAMFLILKKRG